MNDSVRPLHVVVSVKIEIINGLRCCFSVETCFVPGRTRLKRNQRKLVCYRLVLAVTLHPQLS